MRSRMGHPSNSRLLDGRQLASNVQNYKSAELPQPTLEHLDKRNQVELANTRQRIPRFDRWTVNALFVHTAPLGALRCMFGKKACDLLREVARCNPEAIPPYNDEGVREVVEELTLHDDAMAGIIKSVSDQEADRQELAEGVEVDVEWGRYSNEASAIIVHHDSILRNKRVLWTYTTKRMGLIRELRWQSRFLPAHVRQNFSPPELQYFDGYNKLLTTGLRAYPGYTSDSDLGVGLDLTLDEAPPKGYLVNVRVVRDYGEVAFSVGAAQLAAGSVHTLPLDEAQPLLRSGVLENLDDFS